MSTRLISELTALRDRVARVRPGLAVPGADDARRSRREIVGQVDDYLLPRLRQIDAPLLVAVGGSTGAGKSTLVNTLVGDAVSRAGWLRPTTRAPVLVCNPDDVHWFADDRVLPGLARTTGDEPPPTESAEIGPVRTLRVVPHPSVPAGLALLDPPDIDSVVAGNRELAAQLLAAADLWIFVTTAARYADAVPWDLLHTARQRSTALAVVLNRVPPEGVDEIGGHLGGMLAEEGLADGVELFVIPEVPLADELIPDAAIEPLRTWLDALAADATARAEIVRTTLLGALRSLHGRVDDLAEHLDDQGRTADALRAEAADPYTAAIAEVDDGVRSGSVLRGEVLARWQEFVGAGDFTRGLEARIGRARDRVAAFLMGRPYRASAVEQAVESSLEMLVRAAAERAAERTVESWRMRPAGRALLGEHIRLLEQASSDFTERLTAEVRAWQGQVLELVAHEGGHRRTIARFSSFGVNGAGLALMLVIFAQTAGLSGLEIVVAGGTTAVNHKLLDAVFGDAAVRSLANQARDDLRDRVAALMAAERDRFDALVEAAAPDGDGVAALRAALAEFDAAAGAASLSASVPAPAPTGRGDR
jgi:hypothetical protein